MAKISQYLENENRLLAEKVKIIYEVFCHKNISELLELFSDPLDAKNNPNYYHNRKKSLQRILRNQTARVSHFQKAYSRMKISKLRYKKEILFESDFFFYSSIDRFKRHINAYMDDLAVNEIGLDLEYKYIYFFDHKVKKGGMVIERYEIDYVTKKVLDADRGLEINLYQKHQTYKGYIQNNNQRVVISVKNSHDNLTMLFNASLLGSSSCIYFDKALYGVAIGIDDKHQKIPVAKKVVLMQRKLDSKELEKLYLILNETQTIEVRENLYALDLDTKFDIKYLAHYEKNIFNIHNFFSSLKYSKNIDTQISDHMVFTEFHAFCMMYEKYANNQNFFLNDRKRIVLELFRFLEMYPSKKVIMSLPIYDKNDNLFLYEVVDKISTTELLINHAKSGIKFEILFIVKRPQDYLAPHMEGIFAQLNEAGVEFGFIDKKTAERKANNLDFIYTSEHDFAIIKDHPEHKAVFTVTKTSGFIRGCIRDFQTIKNISYSYEEVMDDTCTLAVYDEVLLKMLGTWYGYFYSGVKDEKQEQLIQKMKFTVLNDYSIYSKVQNGCNSKGFIETALHQTLFSLVCENTKESQYLVFDNHRIDDLFQVMLYSKQYNNEHDMANAGLLSRKKLSSKLVRALLGEPEELMLKIKPDLQERIKNHISERKISNLLS